MHETRAVLKIAQTLQRNAYRDSELDFVSISCALRNRLARNQKSASRCREYPKVSPDHRSFEATLGKTTPDLMLIAIASGALCGLYEDPTGGATRFHRHDVCPAWAEKLQCTALLGSYIYYREQHS